MKMLRSLALLSAFSAAIASAGRLPAQNAIGRIGDVSIPQVTVNFGMEPYPPHTDAIIGLDKGWFKDVGIDLQWKNVQADQVAPLLIAGTVDVASAAPALLIPSMRQAKFDSFVFGDIFQAYAIMAQPDAGYKSYKDFVAQGKAPADALKAAMQQLKGKVFTYPAEAAVKPFIQLLFKRGDLALEDTTTEVQPDPNGVALMLSKRADFEIGGLPAHYARAGRIQADRHCRRSCERRDRLPELRRAALNHACWLDHNTEVRRRQSRYAFAARQRQVPHCPVPE